VVGVRVVIIDVGDTSVPIILRTIAVVIEAIAIFEPEVRTGREDTGENEVRAEGPERVVIRPQHERNHVA
jgi:hypothetical protein